MAKNNSYIARQQAQKAAEIKAHRYFTMQWCADAALLAAHEVFQRKGDILAEFNEAFVRRAMMIAEITLEDAKSDKSIDYTKGKVDGQLKEILGEHFVPWEERYDFFRSDGGMNK